MSTYPKEPATPEEPIPPSGTDQPEGLDGPPESLSTLLQQMQPAQPKQLKRPTRRVGPEHVQRQTQSAASEPRERPKAKKERKPLQDADLKWFDIQQYDQARLSRLSLADWRGLISLRLTYQSHIVPRELSDAEVKYLSNIKRPDQAKWLDHFLDYLKRDPLELHRDMDLNWHPKHKTDTASISSMLFSEAFGIAESLQGLWPADLSQPYSLPNDRYEKRGDLGLLVLPVKVNFSVTKTKLVEDFSAWVDRIQKLDPRLKAKAKNFPSLMSTWSTKGYLPYFDLALYSRATNRSISQAQYVRLLGLNPDDEADYADLLEAPKSSLKTFTPETLSAIEAQLARNVLNDGGEMYVKTPISRKPQGMRLKK